jgi:hypothetical protein
MTIKEANRIFKFWQEYVEINDKMWKIFTSIPKSFLPYPVEVLEEALNIIAKSYFDEGDSKTSEAIQSSIAMLIKYKDDEEAIIDIAENPILKTPELRKLYLKNLKKTSDSWLEMKESSYIHY